METTPVLDTPAIEKSSMEYASKGARFANYIVDIIVCYLLIFLIAMGLAIIAPEAFDDNMESATFNILILFLFIAYYVIFENTWGKTPGKFITRTHVVTETGERPTLANIIGRSLCRFIPFDAFTFLTSTIGWHDSISKTCVVKDNPKP